MHSIFTMFTKFILFENGGGHTYKNIASFKKVTTIVQFYCIIMHHLCLLMTPAVTEVVVPYKHAYTHMNALWLWQNSTQAKGLSTQNNLEALRYVFFFLL